MLQLGQHKPVKQLEVLGISTKALGSFYKHNKVAAYITTETKLDLLYREGELVLAFYLKEKCCDEEIFMETCK